MKIGAIYKAPWGTYAILSIVPLVLRSLDTMNACVMPSDNALDPAYVATGEHVQPTVRPKPGVSESVPRVTSQVPVSTSSGLHQPELVDIRCVSSLATVSETGKSPETGNSYNLPPIPVPAPLTQGGMRPGTGLCIIPGRPTLWWRPCLTRTEYGGISHCSFLSLTNDQSLYCWECRKHKPWIIIVKKQVEPALASSPSTSVPELSTAMAPAPELSGGRELSPVVSSSSLPPVIPAQHSAGVGDLSPASVSVRIPTQATRPSIPLVPGTSPKEDVGGFDRQRRPEYRPATLAAWKEEVGERAAIIEYLAGKTRQVAEHMAREIVGPAPNAIPFTKGARYVPDGENHW